MPRRRKADAERAEAAKAVANLARTKRKKPSTRKGPTKAGVQRMIREANKMREANDWSKARPAHLVALYAWCHEQVYDVAPAELIGLNWMAAASAAAKMVREEFDGSIEAAVDYLRWTWRREQGREQWRRENQREGGRVSWRAQFQQRYILTDYRIDRARKR